MTRKKKQQLPTLEELQRRNREDPFALSFAELELMRKLEAEQRLPKPVKYQPLPEGLAQLFTGISEQRDKLPPKKRTRKQPRPRVEESE